MSASRLSGTVCLALALLLSACHKGGAASSPLTPSLRIAADVSVTPLAEGLLNAYETRFSGAQLSMAPTGRQAALSALEAGEVDAVLLLHPFQANSLFHTPIAREMLLIVVHPEVTLDTLARSEVRAIFSGGVATWDELGGPPIPIEVITRERGSSTRLAFDSLVMEGQSMTPSARLGVSDGHVLELAAATPGAIGYVPRSLLDSRVRPLAYDGARPTPQAAQDGTYALVTQVELVTLDEPHGSARAFLDWILSDEGQEVVRRYMLGLND